jgi:hypothetical protein
MARPGSVLVESVEGPMVVASAAAAPNTANILRVREPVRVNISPRARWSSSSEGRGRRRRTKKFPVARMRDRPPTPRATRIYPRLRRPPVVPARVRDWVARDRAHNRGMPRIIDLSPISPSSADIRRYMEDQSLWGDSSSFSSPPLSPATRYGYMSRSRSPSSRSSMSPSPRRLMVRINREGRATRYGVPRIAPPPAGRPRTLRRNRPFRFRDDDDRRHRRELRKTRKRLERMMGRKIPKVSSSSSSSSSRSRSRSRHSDDDAPPPPPPPEGVQSGGRQASFSFH